MSKRVSALLLAVSMGLVAAGCGGGGGGGGGSGGTTDPGTNPTPNPGTDPTPNPGTDPTPNPGTDPTPDPGTDPTPDPGTPERFRNITFDNDASTVAAIVAGNDADDPALILMRQGGLAQRLVAVLADGSPVSAELDAVGRLVNLELGGYRFSLSGYTGSTATLTYQLPDAGEASTQLDVSQCVAMPASGNTTAAGLAALLNWYTESGYACLSDRLADIGAPLQEIGRYAERLQQNQFQLDYSVRNRVVCGGTLAQCAATLAPHAQELIEGLRALDPDGTTQAGFTVSDAGVRLIRSEWDPLILDGSLDMSLDWRKLACDRSLFAEIDQTCTAQYVPPANNLPYPYGDFFVVNGITYHTGPVLTEKITGFGWPLTGVSINDGEAAGGRVWYGTNSCMTFRIDGRGVQDMKGGTSTTIDSFPWVETQFKPGTKGVAIPQMRGFTYPVRSLPDPNYNRRSELRGFQWGVRINDDGSVHRDSNGYYEFYLKFDDGSVLRAAWDPATNGPASSFSNALRGYVNTPPTQSHFCIFREATSQDLVTHCLTNTTTSNPTNGKRTLCYKAGYLNGEYRLEDQYGNTLEEGQFENNRPSGGWQFLRDDGTLLANGSFAENGAPGGEWTYYDNTGSKSEVVRFSSAASLYEPWNAYFRHLDGRYMKYQGGMLNEEGSLLEGQQNGWWYYYRAPTGPNAGVLYEAHEYDANTQIPTGGTMCRNGDCIPLTRSWLKSTQNYNWSACGVQTPWITERTYNYDGSLATTTCYRLNGTPLEPERGEQLEYCPRPCA